MGTLGDGLGTHYDRAAVDHGGGMPQAAADDRLSAVIAVLDGAAPSAVRTARPGCEPSVLIDALRALLEATGVHVRRLAGEQGQVLLIEDTTPIAVVAAGPVEGPVAWLRWSCDPPTLAAIAVGFDAEAPTARPASPPLADGIDGLLTAVTDAPTAAQERLAALLAHTALATHQLNNPLATLAMAGSLLGPLGDEGERQRFGSMLEREALRAGRIAEELRELVTLPPPAPVAIETGPLVADAVQRASDGHAEVEVLGRHWPVVTADPPRLRLALVTVLRQLLRAQPAGRGLTVGPPAAADPQGRFPVDAPGVPWRDAIRTALDAAPVGPAGDDSTTEALFVAGVLLREQGGGLEARPLADGGTRVTIRPVVHERSL